MVIQRVLVVFNKMKSGTVNIATQIKAKMNELEIDCQLFGYLDNPSEVVCHHPIDFVFVLGGDGTVLFSARMLYKLEVPILPINMGSIGFITEVSASEWLDAFLTYKNGQLDVSKRIMIRATVYRNGKKITDLVGLNDGVIGSSGASKIVRYQIDVNGVSLGEYRADGVILATPTGATGYSLAAGGPLIYPEAEALLVTPICPHSLTKRPIVIPGNENIRVTLDKEQRTKISLTIDGQVEYFLEPGDEVVFSKTSEKTIIVKSDKRSFYEVIRTKLGG
ncbi:NAD(+)/NADH kinase [Spirochaeta cellobiosiphila]|uniref:NAD(+)/NADH kinase n=1 Tax=Spirochaeta cellobiosiphila TaxID=504483 RepID=UPI00040C4536|nr:NAD(+)/NADH kinase [Spirochaeta cellobiosiphila]